jgi:hypothetical protein
MSDAMGTPGGTPGGGNQLFQRAKSILLKPAEEWPVIAGEPATPAGLITRYALPLAAIGPVAGFLHGQLFGYGMFGVSWHPGFVAALSTALVSFVLNLVGIVVLAFIADFLAPKFAGTSDRTAAFKLVVYGSTAAWLAGAFNVIPGLGVLGLLGLYSLYLYYTGAAPMMKVPADKAAGYTAVTIVCAIVLYLVVGAISAGFLHMFGGGIGAGMMTPQDGQVSGKLTLPGMAPIDVDKAQQAANQMRDAASGKKPPIDPARLQALLPATVAGFTRSSTEASGMSMGSSASGTYTDGAGHSFELKITDMAALGAIAGLGTAMGIQESKQDANGYEKTGTVDGHLQTEAWHNDSHSGKFSVMVGNRFSVEADGSADSIDRLKAAVAGVDQGALSGLGG